MRGGDVVCVLQGSRWPVILREDGEYCKMLGVSYVHRIMHGEAIRLRQQSGSETTEFQIV